MRSSLRLFAVWTLAMMFAWPLAFLATELSRFVKDLVLLPEEAPLIPIFLVWGALTLVLGGLVLWLPNALVLRGRLSLRPWFVAASLCLLAAVVEIVMRTILSLLVPQFSDVLAPGPGTQSQGPFGLNGGNVFLEFVAVGSIFAGIAFWLVYRFPFYWGVAVIAGGWLAQAAGRAIAASQNPLVASINAGFDGYGVGLPTFIVGGLVFGMATGFAVMLMDARNQFPRKKPVTMPAVQFV